jgi:hypothetical protein
MGELGKHEVPIPCLSNSMEIFIYPCSPFLFEHVESNFCFDENKKFKGYLSNTHHPSMHHARWMLCG